MRSTGRTPPPTPPNKIVAIAIGYANKLDVLFALCHDGSLWRSELMDSGMQTEWARLDPIPAAELAEPMTHDAAKRAR